MRLACSRGDPATAADEADVALRVSTRPTCAPLGPGDYTGELSLRLPLRITDRDNGGTPTTDHGTVPTPLDVHGALHGDRDTTRGSTCALVDDRRRAAPGAAREGKRAIWALDRVAVLDGGPDGVASTPPNTLFAVQGVFVP